MDKALVLLKEIRNSRDVSWEMLSCAIEVALERKAMWSDDDKNVFLIIVASLMGGGNAKALPPLPDGSYISTRTSLFFSKENIDFLIHALLKVFPQNCLWEEFSFLNNLSVMERAFLDDDALENVPSLLDKLPSQYFKNNTNPKLEDAVWLMIENGKRLTNKHSMAPVSNVFDILHEKGFDFSIKRNNIPLMKYCINSDMWELYLRQGGDPISLKVEEKPLWQYLASPFHHHLRSHILKWAEENTNEKEDFIKGEYFKELEKYARGRYATLATLKKAVFSPHLKWWELSNDQGQTPLMLLMPCHENSLSLFKAKRCAPMFSKRDNLDRSIAFYILGSECSSDKMNLVFTNKELMRPSSVQGGLFTQLSLEGHGQLITKNPDLFARLIKNHSYEMWFEKIENHPEAFQKMLLNNNALGPHLYHLHLLGQRFFNECQDPFVRSVFVLATALSSIRGVFHQKASWGDFEKLCQENPSWDEKIFDMLNACKEVTGEDNFNKIKTTLEKYYISNEISTDNKQKKMTKKM